MTVKPGIGHNNGPSLDGQAGWRRHCWSKARKELIGNRVPVEIVRSRIRRARALGLSYPQYASILMGSGRDIVGFLFTVGGLQLRLQRLLEMPEPVQEKLASLAPCTLLGFAPEGEVPADFEAELQQVSGLPIRTQAPQPGEAANWSEARDAVRKALAPLPGRSIVLIGSRDCEESWASAARVAKFLHTDAYFGQREA